MEDIHDFASHAFLSENAETFGLISDAHPMATDVWMIAANGHAPNDGMHPPTFAVSGKGVDGLYDGLYSSLIHRSDDNEKILRLTFGESEGRQSHPIARYCAALCVALGYQTLSEMQDDTAKTCARELSRVLPEGIDNLRDVMRAAVGPRPGSEHFFAVSFCACRVKSAEAGQYSIDIFHAGDFSLYILDEFGMSPLYVSDSDVLEPLETSMVQLEQITLHHEHPFALFLLSPSVCNLSSQDFRAMQDASGLLWRYRMRLEDQLIRLVTSCAKQEELHERIERFYTGRAVGRDSATGAWMILGVSFDAFKTICQTRLHHLEQLISLLPKGYDPEHPTQQIPLERVERAFILSAFRSRPGLTERTMDAISKRAVELLHSGGDAAKDQDDESVAPRLTYDMVRRVFLSFDCQNTADREQIAKNCQVMKDLLRQHWTTLRPLFCRSPMADEVTPAMQQKSDTANKACIALKQRIAELVCERRQVFVAMREKMTSCLDVLRVHEEDWIGGTSGDDSAFVWLREAGLHLQNHVKAVRATYENSTDRLRSLQSAYAHERALSFDIDTAEGGVWHTHCQMIMDGVLPPDIWRVYANDMAEKATAYTDFLRVLHTISERNATLYERIEGRGAERRMVLTLSGDEDWQVACMLGALWEDTTWGESISSLVDNGFRNEYKALRRRWLEERELLVRQAEAFETYRNMYTRYANPEI